MKVLLINRTFEGAGGAEAAVRGLFHALRTLGHQVTVVHQRGGRRTRSANIIVRICVFLADWINVWEPLRVQRALMREKPEVIHTHNMRGMGMLLPLWIRCAKGRARWFHTVHDIQLVYPSGVCLYPALEPVTKSGLRAHGCAITDPWYCRAYAWLQRGIWGSPDRVISPSAFLKNFYEERGFFCNSKFIVVPNVLEVFARGRGSAREKDTDARPAALLFVGALEESKGAQILIDAVRQGDIDVAVNMVGEGSMRKMMAQKHLSNVVWHGALSNATIAELMGRALVTVVPSMTYENAPMVILESFRAGVPVVASRIGGIPEYLEDGITGWLVEPGNVLALSALLQKVVQEGVSEEMRRNCIRKAIDINVVSMQGHLSLCMPS